MQHDEVIWQAINQGFCSFKVKTVTQTFCKNPYNVTGLCNRSSCPLANSRYATVVEKEGVCYLYVKTIERAHMPNRLWEKIKLSGDYLKAIDQIHQELAYWPNFIVHKCKQRLTKITQYLIRMRKLKLQVRPVIVGIKKKEERVEARKQKRAEAAANIDDKIKKELLDRLAKGTYEGIYNFPQKSFEQVIEENQLEEAEQDGEQAEYEEEREDQSEPVREFVADIDGDAGEGDLEDVAEEIDVDSFVARLRARQPLADTKSRSKRKRTMELEFEQEKDSVVAHN
jgi:protein MAK16